MAEQFAGQPMQLAGQPILILKEGSQRTKGKEAQSNNIMAAKAVAAAVRTALGPKGMDKMLVNSVGDIVITNDGATKIKDAKILLYNEALDIKKTETKAEISINMPNQLQLFLDHEEQMIQDMVNKIINSGANVVLSEKSIDDMYVI